MEGLFVQTENQRAFVETVGRFVEEEVVPRAAALDAEPDPAKCYSWDIVEKAHVLGVRTMTLDEKWGGLGAVPYRRRENQRRVDRQRHEALASVSSGS